MRKPLSDSTEIAARMECHLPKAFKIHKVVRCIYLPEHRMHWEFNFDAYDKTPRVPDANCLLYELYSRGKKHFGVAQRDFLEKGVQLWDGERYWNYTSSICHLDDKGVPVASNDLQPEGAVRSVSAYSLLMLEREKHDKKNLGKIKMTSLQSFDSFVTIPAVVFDPAVAKSTKGWVEGLTKYYTKNHKKL